MKSDSQQHFSQVDVIQSFTGFALANGCHLSRNSFALLPYVHKECCEEKYRSDRNGCLVGGQFNGRWDAQIGSSYDANSTKSWTSLLREAVFDNDQFLRHVDIFG